MSRLASSALPHTGASTKEQHEIAEKLRSSAEETSQIAREIRRSFADMEDAKNIKYRA